MRPTISPRFGAAFAAVGALGIFLNNFRHPFPPTDRVAFLRLIAGEPHWAAIHFPTMFCALAVLVGLVALADTMPEGAAASLARAGRTVAQVGVPIMLAGAAIDGYGFKAMADAWTAAPAAERAMIERAADAVVWAETGLLHTWVAVFLGVPFVLYGAAVAASARYPRWAGWLGVAGGLGCLASGAAGFLRLPLDLPFPIFGTVDLAWLALMAALMVRGERAARDERLR